MARMTIRTIVCTITARPGTVGPVIGACIRRSTASTMASRYPPTAQTKLRHTAITAHSNGRPIAGATRRYSQSVFKTVERSSGG